MTSINAPANVRRAEIQATVIRADGRVEHLGTVAYYDSNPLRRWFWRVKGLLRG